FLAMEDVTNNLDSFSLECGLSEDEKKLLHLRARSAALTLTGCAHAVFLCELVHSLRTSIKNHRQSVASEKDGDLCVGIVGMGHMGKQVLLSILKKTSIKPSQIKISTRRPEYLCCTLTDRQTLCFFDNGRVAAWADVVFLCCLPSHLPKVCADLRSHLSKHSLVYSFTSAVPVSRLAQLLGHSFIVRPQSDFAAWDSTDVWLSCMHVTTALNNPSLIRASCPLTSDGTLYYIIVDILQHTQKNMYKICNTQNVKTNVIKGYVLSLFPARPFPWISLCDAQTKETPLLRFLSSSKSTQQCISAAYKTLLEAQTQQD
uniref:NADP-dependent oxidoreductase domain-containing protein 1 n=1 Tax=Sphaeramia orbicularis TaxID=375764 RepID=A0A673AYM8_9TELE